jgi:hypothetical protein
VIVVAYLVELEVVALVAKVVGLAQVALEGHVQLVGKRHKGHRHRRPPGVADW